MVANAGRDLGTVGSKRATGNATLSSGRDTVLGDLAVGNKLAATSARELGAGLQRHQR